MGLKKILLLTIIMSCAFGVAMATATVPGEKPYRLVTENYVVQDGDTLDSIAMYYIKKNTYGPREINEFREGIRELNYDMIKDGDVKKGEMLKINYWISNQSAEDTNEKTDKN